MSNTLHEPARELPVLGEYDVVVCGGGPAGCAAATGAARHGAHTLLIEKDGYLGGATVSQLVCVVLSTNGVDFQGVWHDYARGLQRRGGWRELEGFGSGQIRGCVDPEMVKFVWDELLSLAGVDLLHHVYGCTCLVEDGTATGVIAETRAGRRAILAKRVIDCTGDGIVAAQSGVAWDQGDGEHKYAMALTKVFRLGGLPADLPRPDEAAMQLISERLENAVARGEYDSPVLVEKKRMLGYICGWAWRLPERRREMLSVISRVLKVDPLDPFDFTRAEREGREQARQAADFLCRHVPGFENAYLLDTSNQIGLRSSRRLRGLATVTEQDAREFRKYPDSIARSSWDIDVWPADSYSAPAVDRDSEAYKIRHAKLKAGEYFATRNNTVVVTTEARPGQGGDYDFNDVLMRRSTDGGKTFAPFAKLVDHTTYGEGPASNFVMIQDRDSGRIVAVFCHDYARVFTLHSDNEGATWSEPVEITEVFDAFKTDYPWRVCATGPAHGTQLRNGRMIISVWLSDGSGSEMGKHRGHRPSAVAVIHSDDGGATWQRGEIVCRHGDMVGDETIINPSETVAVELANNSILFNVRSESKIHRRFRPRLAGGKRQNNHKVNHIMPLTHAELLQLKRWNTPTIYNGWEQITAHDIAADGFNLEECRDFMPQMGPMVGYAITVQFTPNNARSSVRA